MSLNIIVFIGTCFLLIKTNHCDNRTQRFDYTIEMPQHIKHGEYFEMRTCIGSKLDSEIITVKVILLNERKEFIFLQQDPRIVIPYANRSFRLLPERKICFTDVLQPTKVGIQDIAVEFIEEKSTDDITQFLRFTIINVENVGIQQFIMNPFIVDFQDSNKRNTTHFDVFRINEDIIVDVTMKYNVFKTYLTYLSLYNVIDVEKAIFNLAELLAMAEWSIAADPNLKDEITDFLPFELVIKKLFKYATHENGFLSYTKGNTWTTIMAIKYLLHASNYMDIDEDLTINSLKWLRKIQNENGNFQQIGEIPFCGLEITTRPDIGITALALQAIVTRKEEPQYNQMIENGLEHLRNGCRNSNDIYALAIAVHTLNLYNESTNYILDKIQPLVKKDKDNMWWEYDFSEMQKKIYSEPERMSINLEITTYMLLFYVQSDLSIKTFPIMHWLHANHKFNNHFPGIQTSLMLMEAFRWFSQKNGHFPKPSLEIYYLENDSHVNSMSIFNDQQVNAIHKKNLDKSVEKIRMKKVRGNGYAIGIMNQKYFNLTERVHPNYHLDINFVKSNDKNLMINACASYYVTYEEMKPSHTILEVEIPSGYLMEPVKWERIVQEDDNIKLKPGSNVIEIRLAGLDNTPICTELFLIKSFLILERKPYTAKLYNYYNSFQETIKFFQIDT